MSGLGRQAHHPIGGFAPAFLTCPKSPVCCACSTGADGAEPWSCLTGTPSNLQRAISQPPLLRRQSWSLRQHSSPAGAVPSPQEVADSHESTLQPLGDPLTAPLPPAQPPASPAGEQLSCTTPRTIWYRTPVSGHCRWRTAVHGNGGQSAGLFVGQCSCRMVHSLHCALERHLTSVCAGQAVMSLGPGSTAPMAVVTLACCSRPVLQRMCSRPAELPPPARATVARLAPR